jgi:hypothetical protein
VLRGPDRSVRSEGVQIVRYSWILDDLDGSRRRGCCHRVATATSTRRRETMVSVRPGSRPRLSGLLRLRTPVPEASVAAGMLAEPVWWKGRMASMLSCSRLAPASS